MAKLYFKYSTMNSGKSASLLQSAHNYVESGKSVLYFNAAIDTRYGEGKIASRIGLQHDAIPYHHDFNFYEHVLEHIISVNLPDAIFIDESQFLSEKQVLELCEIVDVLNIPVLCYGIRNDYQGNLFEGSRTLLCNADQIDELKGICSDRGCNKKATHILRYVDGELQKEGKQTIVGDQEYESVCRYHFMTAMEIYK